MTSFWSLHESHVVVRSSSQWVLVLVALFVLSACSSNSFLGRHYANFTAYFNTFYNAKRSYNEGVRSIEATQRSVERDEYLSVMPQKATGSGTQSFQDAIEKSAKILREHPNSHWVDEALLLIGKCYFYQENYIAAEQKFQEVISLSNEKEDEAYFWLGRTLLKRRSYETAISALEQRLGQDDVEADWAPRLRLILGELYVRQKEWDQAAQHLSRGLENVDDNQMGGRAQFLLAQVYETIGEYTKAAQAYRAVQNYNPRYTLAYEAQRSYAAVLGLHVDPRKALEHLASMQADDKHYENRAELALLQARLLQEMGQVKQAWQLYQDVLYSSYYSGGSVNAETHYRLGELYRDEWRDFALAAAHFDTAATRRSSGNPSDMDVQYTPWAVQNLSDTAQVFKEFDRQINQINRLDSLLHLGSLNSAEFDSAIMVIRQQKLADLRAKQQQEQRQDARAQYQSNLQSRRSQNSQRAQRQTSSAVSTAEEQDSGFLFHRNEVRVQENMSRFQVQWGERPLVPNWRRRAAIRASATTADAETDSAAAPASRAQQMEDGTLGMNLAEIPRDSASRVAMNEERAREWYRLANHLFLSMNRPDSAATWYRHVIQNHPDLPVARRAKYALAELHRSQGDTSEARTIFADLLERHPESVFAPSARRHLGMRQPDEDQEVSDSLRKARRAYEQAYALWQKEGLHRDAFSGMLETAHSFHSTAVAPRSLLGAAYIYVEWARADSFYVRRPFPEDIIGQCCRPDSLGGRPSGTIFPDSVRSDSLTIDHLLRIVSRKYGNTRYARRAELLQEGLPALPDSTSRPGSQMATDSLAGPATSDSVASADSTGAPMSQASDRSASSGSETATAGHSETGSVQTARPGSPETGDESDDPGSGDSSADVDDRPASSVTDPRRSTGR